MTVIKHWRLHNCLRKDRIKPTLYQDKFNQLEIKPDGAYTEKKLDGCQVVELPPLKMMNQKKPVSYVLVAKLVVKSQPRIDKDSLVKDTKII